MLHFSLFSLEGEQYLAKHQIYTGLKYLWNFQVNKEALYIKELVRKRVRVKKTSLNSVNKAVLKR